MVESGNNPERSRAIVIVSNYLGLRAKEIAALKVKDVYDGHSIKKVANLSILPRAILRQKNQRLREPQEHSQKRRLNRAGRL